MPETSAFLLTCDLCDAHESLLAQGSLRVLPPVFLSFGAKTQFAGPAATLRLFEDNGMVRSTLETAGQGRVLVIDGGGSLRCALVGGNLAVLAEKNGWAGIIVHGCVRDTAEINACQIGVRALAAMPVRSVKKGGGEAEVTVTIAGVRIAPGQWIYADADGVLVADQALHT
ncbi:ribonuclease E activity regulator RraA [Undibacterium sp. CY7W]|uniref:4-hydroxy-4-methyl-2-oxoglutarate aldolase n=1 Tax=Undibacterium rugosum TaxID=2762291 RepID=A0A923I8H1_9BURK|nr:ribonuclease E activity regulator RraA [Undibacterium rugosum]MBC3935503.1 ribonuclease E activity regulator RraA [Undibacterium rugosum]